MKQKIKLHHFSYLAVFAIMGLVITSTVYMATGTNRESSEEPVDYLEMSRSTGDVNFVVYDVDPVTIDDPTSSRVGNTIRAEWSLTANEGSVTLSYSTDDGLTWVDVLVGADSVSYSLFQIPETQAEQMLVKIDAEGQQIIRPITLIQDTAQSIENIQVKNRSKNL